MNSWIDSAAGGAAVADPDVAAAEPASEADDPAAWPLAPAAAPPGAGPDASPLRKESKSTFGAAGASLAAAPVVEKPMARPMPMTSTQRVMDATAQATPTGGPRRAVSHSRE